MLIAALASLLLATDITFPPSFAGYGTATSENSSLSMTCEGKGTFASLKCKFTEVVLVVPSEAEVQRHLAERKAEETKATAQEVAAFLTGMKKECSGERPRLEVLDSPSKERARQQDLEIWEAVCKCTDGECADRQILKQEEIKQRTCRIYAHSYELTLRRTGPLSWVGTHGPGGACGNIEVSTLERDPKSEILWTFTWVRASANKNGSLCAALASELNKPTVWSWRYPCDLLETRCQRFHMGR